MKDIVFLFGAGASYGAGGILPEPPPLGSELYPILARNYPGSWGALPEDVRDTFRSDFEAGMQIVYDRFGQAIPALMREMAVYFVQFRPYKGLSLYCRLVSDLADSDLLSRTLFSTLNYECVLEYSLLEQGHGVSYFDEGDSDQIPVWKLHGSCNMFAHTIRARPGVTYSTGVTWQSGIEAFLDSNRVIQHCLVETALAPVMCLYMKGKPLNVSPGAVRSQQERWAKLVNTASAVVSIGVRPVPDDEHVWNPLASTPAQFYYIGNRDALEEWRKRCRTSNTEYLGARFNEGYSLLIRRLIENGTLDK